jgi:hypothetical protein
MTFAPLRPRAVLDSCRGAAPDSTSPPGAQLRQIRAMLAGRRTSSCARHPGTARPGAHHGHPRPAPDGVPRRRRGRDPILTTTIRATAAQVLVGVFADPHPGLPVVDRPIPAAILDFGCVERLDADARRGYAAVVMAVAAGDDASWRGTG